MTQEELLEILPEEKFNNYEIVVVSGQEDNPLCHTITGIRIDRANKTIKIVIDE